MEKLKIQRQLPRCYYEVFRLDISLIVDKNKLTKQNFALNNFVKTIKQTQDGSGVHIPMEAVSLGKSSALMVEIFNINEQT